MVSLGGVPGAEEKLDELGRRADSSLFRAENENSSFRRETDSGSDKRDFLAAVGFDGDPTEDEGKPEDELLECEYTANGLDEIEAGLLENPAGFLDNCDVAVGGTYDLKEELDV